MNVSRLPIGTAVNPQTILDAFRQSVRHSSSILYNAAQKADVEASIAHNSLDLLHTSDLAIAPFAVSLGGQDLLNPANIQYLVDTLRELGSADLSIGRLYEGHVNAVDLVSRYGSVTQVRSLAEAVAGGGLSGVWGAEDLKGLHAHRTPDGWQLTGKKILASGAGLLKHPLVSATTEEGQVLFLLTLAPGERADVSGWTAQGMRSSATGSVELTGMAVSGEQVIGKPGDFMRQPHFSGGAWRFCAVHLGAMERLLDLFREHLVSRKRTSDPYQLQRIAQSVVAVATTRLWVNKSARDLAVAALNSEDVVAQANLTRMVTERSALELMELVHRGVGLTAFIQPNPIERITRDLATYLRQPVPDLAMSNAAARILDTDTRAAELWGAS